MARDTFLAGLAVLACAAAAVAQDKPQSSTFEALDRNRDGRISLDEASANDKLFTLFKGLDSNKDGSLSKEEFVAYNPAAASER